MGSCYSVGSNTRYSRLDHGPASVSTRPKYFSDHVVGKATENSSHDTTLEEAGLDPVYVAWIKEQSSKLDEEDQMGSCDSVGLNARYSSLDHGSAFVPTRPKHFSYDVLKTATRNFSCGMMLVEAGPDSIYVGWIDEQSRVATKPGTGIAIAVKNVYLSCPYGTYKEWKAEISYLGQLNHQNIVKLIGYCHLTVKCGIHVYEFMPKGCLQSLLFRRSDDSEVPLSWNRRLNIAVGVAKGLAYLDTTKAHIRDHVLASSMILIDSNYNAKLSNLVVDKPYSGYVAPEYKVKGNLSAKSEVYSFGVVLLELLTGVPAYKNVVEFANRHLRNEGKMLDIMDPRIEGQYSSAVAKRVGLLAMRCLMNDPKLRPDADELVSELEQMSCRTCRIAKEKALINKFGGLKDY